MIVRHMLHELDLVLHRPGVRAVKVPLVFGLGQILPKINKPLIDPRRMAHKRVSAKLSRAIETRDNVTLNNNNGCAVPDVIRESLAAIEELVWEGCVVVGVCDSEWTAQEKRGATVVDQSHAPEALANVGLFARKASLLSRIMM